MYVGRLLVVGPGVGAYRVSSRSFPNRRIESRGDPDDGAGAPQDRSDDADDESDDGRRSAGDRLAVVPTEDAPETDNPYVAYDCLRGVDGRVVVGNGDHVPSVAGKLDLGCPSRDALASVLLAADFERDRYDTPRIAGVVESDAAHVGVVRRDALVVERVAEPTLVATYERDRPAAYDFDPEDAQAAARAAYDLPFEHPVCAAGATVDSGVETAVYNGD